MIEILSSSALATVQDQGREGYLRYGVGTAGAMDRLALAVGNLLLGNPDDAAGIEIPMFPFRIRFLEDLSFAITGADCSARLGDRPVLPWWTVHAKQGDVLTIGVPTSGTRCYLSLAGGVDVPVVLGSRSTQLRGQFGGFNGRQLQKGDVVKAVGLAKRVVPQDAVLAAGFGTVPPEYSLPAPLSLPAAEAGETVVRVLSTAEYDCYEPESLEAFWRDGWKVTPQSDRYGYRLAGPTLVATHSIEKRSHGIVPGVIQVPHSGQPIIQLRDAQPSGGYPKIGTVIEADLWRLAQARIGTKIRFVQTTYAQAVTALEELDSYLVRVRNLVALFCPSRH
ncbi:MULTISPECIES: biotin-dependent carboxyltransferase family protein [Paraburkholderia]|uniref:5-oxoprolinase subunit C family protein n=1 Tax=Paraburkholderia TaxID=1822464 RepID=UPI00224E20F0|nr:MULTISPECIES: biotin-dependent carboxyltransferase family protein [Paraburkholderia]MCX4176866.1 biotin-dependent carboxyltransferase family protein [Paraburkholderia madseniana]MDQ6464857.1 biotin-dependent carboxyltransferase family protein [Paraburkholderia madseniana]